MYAIITIIISAAVIIAILIRRVGINGRSTSELDRTTKDLRSSNSKRRENDIGIRRDIKTATEKATDLRRNNSARREADRKTREILEGATYREDT